MTIDFGSLDYVRQLHRAGLRPSEKLVQHILRAGDACVEPLIALACDTALLEEDEPECWAPLHALRLLGELRDTRAIAPLVRAYALDELEPPVARRMWEGEVPQILGRLGAPAVEPLWAIADDEAFAITQRSVALTGLAFATSADPELREQVVTGVRQRMAASTEKTFTGHLIAALANLGVSDAYAEVMARFRAGEVDLEVATAAESRQLLLTPNPTRLRCSTHPLWERYDEHGPFPAGAQRAQSAR